MSASLITFFPLRARDTMNTETESIRSAGIQLTFENPSAEYQPLLDAIGDAQLVLIGDASHGTKEFYEQRAEISKLLIEQKGFNVICVEGDWPDCSTVNRFAFVAPIYI